MQSVVICLREHLDQQWAEWLGGFSMTYTDQNETILTGSLPDQAALYGLIAKLRDLGVTLLAIHVGEQTSTGAGRPHPERLP